MHILCILDLQIGFRIKPVIRLSAEINPDLFISTSISSDKYVHLPSPIHIFLEKYVHKMVQ